MPNGPPREVCDAPQGWTNMNHAPQDGRQSALRANRAFAGASRLSVRVDPGAARLLVRRGTRAGCDNSGRFTRPANHDTLDRGQKAVHP